VQCVSVGPAVREDWEGEEGLDRGHCGCPGGEGCGEGLPAALFTCPRARLYSYMPSDEESLKTSGLAGGT